MVSSARFRNTLYTSVLAVLILFEMYMLTAFLPKNSQRAINEELTIRFDRESYEHSRITHPNLEGEMDQILKENPRIKIIVYIIFVAMLSGNALLIKRLWDVLKRKSYQRCEPSIFARMKSWCDCKLTTQMLSVRI